MIQKKLRFSRSMMQRARRLLYMKYRPKELADELGCNVRAVYRRLIPAGCPHERDDEGCFWLIGTQVRDWMLTVQRQSVGADRARLGPGQAYCMVCEKGVDMLEPLETRVVSARLELVQGRCAECGAVVCRGRKRKAADDQSR